MISILSMKAKVVDRSRLWPVPAKVSVSVPGPPKMALSAGSNTRVVVTRAPEQLVIARAAVEGIVAVVPEQRVVAEAARDDVVATEAAQDLVVIAAEQDVDAIATLDLAEIYGSEVDRVGNDDEVQAEIERIGAEGIRTERVRTKGVRAEIAEHQDQRLSPKGIAAA